METFFFRAAQGDSGDAVQPVFLSLNFIGKGYAKELCSIGYTNFEDAIKDGGLAPGGFDQTCDDKQQNSPWSARWTRTPILKIKAYMRLHFVHDVIYNVDMELKKNISGSRRPSTLASSAWTRFPETALAKSVVHIRDKVESHTKTRVAVV